MSLAPETHRLWHSQTQNLFTERWPRRKGVPSHSHSSSLLPFMLVPRLGNCTYRFCLVPKHSTEPCLEEEPGEYLLKPTSKFLFPAPQFPHLYTRILVTLGPCEVPFLVTFWDVWPAEWNSAPALGVSAPLLEAWCSSHPPALMAVRSLSAP